MFNKFKRLLGQSAKGHDARAGKRDRLMFDTWPAAIYAVGDVHGCLRLLERLEDEICADAAGIDGEKWIVMLGDYVDRGPHAAQVIDHLLADPPKGFRRFCLAGNHEEAMLAFLGDPMRNPDWMAIGGADATLASYGINTNELGTALNLKRAIDAAIPTEHIDFVEGLPVMVGVPGLVFVHAGLRPGVPLADQTDEDLVWIRPGTGEVDYDVRVVHGHTPVREPIISNNRIDIDTGAFVFGRLSAVRLLPDGDTKVFSVTG